MRGGVDDRLELQSGEVAAQLLVCRRLHLDADPPLDRLHEAVLAAFGWAGYRMHVFRSGAEEFGLPDPELGFIDERRASLGELIGGVGDRLLYICHFSDAWEHEIAVEQPARRRSPGQVPCPSAANGACPPEDCGGP